MDSSCVSYGGSCLLGPHGSRPGGCVHFVPPGLSSSSCRAFMSGLRVGLSGNCLCRCARRCEAPRPAWLGRRTPAPELHRQSVRTRGASGILSCRPRLESTPAEGRGMEMARPRVAPPHGSCGHAEQDGHRRIRTRLWRVSAPRSGWVARRNSVDGGRQSCIPAVLRCDPIEHR